MKIRSLFLCGLSWLLAIGNACRSEPQDSSEVRTDLRNESARSGMALARAFGWSIAVIPFDGEERYFRTEQARQLMAFGQSGRSVVWLNRAAD